MIKVIFLDIDGVLNCLSTPNPRRFPYVVDPTLLSRFQDLVADTGAAVVLTSTWRYDPIGILAARHHCIPFDDVIPDMPGRARCDEIAAWLEAHPEAGRHAVIDDEDDELDELPLFQPSAATGLTQEIAAGVVRYLNGETDEVMRANRLARLGENVLAMLRGHRA
jgi:hypothetical protein